jgi:hypothetical protein
VDTEAVVIMTVIISSVFRSWETDTTNLKVKDGYWWNTSGRDLANMLHEANYSEEVQHHFLGYYRDNICSLLEARSDSNASKSGVGWDSNSLEQLRVEGLDQKQVGSRRRGPHEASLGRREQHSEYDEHAEDGRCIGGEDFGVR